MKDAKGHGSNARGAAAHQTGVGAAVPKGVREIPLADIRRWQDVSPENVAAIRQAMQSGAQLPPIKVVTDSMGAPYGRKYVIRDGSHRYAARQQRLRATIPYELRC